MKKLGLLITLLTSVYFTSYSQSLKIGLDADISNKSINIDDNVFNHQLDNSFTYGVTAKFSYQPNKKISLNTGIGYEQNTFNLAYKFISTEQGDPLVPRKTTKNISYLNIPIQLGYSIYFSDKVFLTPTIGVNFGFKISNSEETTFGAGNTSESNYIFNNLNDVVYSVTFDAPINYQISEVTSIHIAPFIAKALNKIDNPQSNPQGLNIQSDNSYFQFGSHIGFIFTL